MIIQKGSTRPNTRTSNTFVLFINVYFLSNDLEVVHRWQHRSLTILPDGMQVPLSIVPPRVSPSKKREKLTVTDHNNTSIIECSLQNIPNHFAGIQRPPPQLGHRRSVRAPGALFVPEPRQAIHVHDFPECLLDLLWAVAAVASIVVTLLHFRHGHDLNTPIDGRLEVVQCGLDGAEERGGEDVCYLAVVGKVAAYNITLLSAELC